MPPVDVLGVGIHVYSCQSTGDRSNMDIIKPDRLWGVCLSQVLLILLLVKGKKL